MSDEKLSSLITALYTTRQQKKVLEKEEQDLLGQLKPLADPKFDKSPKQSLMGGIARLSRVAGENRSVSADLLLERGVAPDIIQYATKTTPYFRYLTHELKDKE